MLVLASTCLLAGCAGGPVALGSPSPGAADAEVCDALVDDLPATLAGQERRDVDPADALGAAWGEPPLVLLCGGTKPAGQDVFATCTVTDGIGWWAPEDQVADLGVDVTLTSVGTRPLVQVSIPAPYRPEAAAAVMTELAPALRRHLDTVKPCR